MALQSRATEDEATIAVDDFDPLRHGPSFFRAPFNVTTDVWQCKRCSRMA